MLEKLTGWRSSQYRQNCNPHMQKSSSVAFLMIHGAALKGNLRRRELKQANRKVKQNIPDRSSPSGFALLCGDTCGRGFIKINRLVESPGSREAPAGSLLAGAGRDVSGSREDEEPRGEGEPNPNERWEWKNKDRRERERQVHSNGERDGKDKGRSGVWLEELVLLSPPQRPSGGFPRNPAVLNKGRSNGRQRSKTCYFSSLSPNQSCNSEGAAYRLIVAASPDRDREYRVHGQHQYKRKAREYYRQC